MVKRQRGRVRDGRDGTGAGLQAKVVVRVSPTCSGPGPQQTLVCLCRKALPLVSVLNAPKKEQV